MYCKLNKYVILDNEQNHKWWAAHYNFKWYRASSDVCMRAYKEAGEAAGTGVRTPHYHTMHASWFPTTPCILYSYIRLPWHSRWKTINNAEPPTAIPEDVRTIILWIFKLLFQVYYRWPFYFLSLAFTFSVHSMILGFILFVCVAWGRVYVISILTWYAAHDDRRS